MLYPYLGVSPPLANPQISDGTAILIVALIGLLVLASFIGLFFVIRWRIRFERGFAEQRMSSGALSLEEAEKAFLSALRNAGMTWMIFGMIKFGAVLIFRSHPHLTQKFTYPSFMQVFDSVIGITLTVFGSAVLRGSAGVLKVGTLIAGIGAAVAGIYTLWNLVDTSMGAAGEPMLKMFIATIPLIPAFVALQKLLPLNTARRLRDEPLKAVLPLPTASRPPLSPPPMPASHARSVPPPPPASRPSLSPPPTPATRSRSVPPPPPASQSSESIHFGCPTCQVRMTAPRSAVGRQARCPGCAGVVVVPHL